MEAKLLSRDTKPETGKPVIGVFAPCDPRIDQASRERSTNIIKHAAGQLAGKIQLPDGTQAEVVYSDILIDAEAQADQVAKQFKEAGVNILVCVPDTWSFPQLTTLSFSFSSRHSHQFYHWKQWNPSRGGLYTCHIRRHSSVWKVDPYQCGQMA